MAKTQMSQKFSRFADKTTRGSLAKAREAERFARGIPFELGTKGTGVISEVIFDDTKPDDEGTCWPRIRVKIKSETPEATRGKSIQGPGLMQKIAPGKDETKWSQEDAFTAALSMLEDLGLPQSVSTGYKEMQEILDWFEAEPRKVVWEVVADDYWKKAYQCFAATAEGKVPSAEGEKMKDEEDAKYVMYRNAKHKILEDHGDTYDLQSMNDKTRIREGVDKENTNEVS